MKHFNLVTIVSILSAFSMGYSLDLKVGGIFFTPGKAGYSQHSNGSISDGSFSSDLHFGGDLEFSTNIQGLPIRFASGFGYEMPSYDGNKYLAPHLFPIFLGLSFGSFEKDTWFSPYLQLRAGWNALYSKGKNWKNKPEHFFGGVKLGATALGKYGVSANFDYTHLKKDLSPDYYLSFAMMRAGIQLSYNFNLTLERKRRIRSNISDFEEEEEE